MRRFGMRFVLAFSLLALGVAFVDADEPPAVIKRPIRVQPALAPPLTDPALGDENALKQAGLSASDANSLIEYLKARTLTEGDQTRIGDVIKRFGADDFEERVKATEEVERFGPAAISPLKKAESHPDPEIAYRARLALKRMEKVPHSAVAAAAVRAVVKLKPKEGAAALLGFLPMADTEEVADEIRTALVALALADGKPEPAIVAALDDKLVVRRAAAYLALIEGGDSNERIRIKETFAQVKAAVRKEPDTDTKFRGLWALLMTTREKEFLADLIDLIPKLHRGRIWQMEELLLQLAGPAKPDARFGKSEEALTKARDAWAGWWAKAGPKTDLTKFVFSPRSTGHTDIVEFDIRGLGNHRIVTLGPDLKEKAKLTGSGVSQLYNPSDVKKLSNGNYLIVESNRVTERDSTGKIIKTTSVAMPIALDLLPDGGMAVVSRNQVIQYDKEMKQQWSYPRQQYDIMSGRRLPGGDIIFVTNTPQGVNCYRLSGKDGKEVGKPLQLGRIIYNQSFDATGDEKILVCEYNRVIEYDLKDGEKAKEVWKYECNGPLSCQRLPNGNTLITHSHNGTNRVIEVDPSGEILWVYTSPEGLRPVRAYRR